MLASAIVPHDFPSALTHARAPTISARVVAAARGWGVARGGSKSRARRRSCSRTRRTSATSATSSAALPMSSSSSLPTPSLSTLSQASGSPSSTKGMAQGTLYGLLDVEGKESLELPMCKEAANKSLRAFLGFSETCLLIGYWLQNKKEVIFCL